MLETFIITLIGALSAYNQAPTDGTIAYRQDAGQIPRRPFEFYAAVQSCDHIGQRARLYAGGEVYHGIIFDCAGDHAAFDWMACEPNSGIVYCAVALEADYYFVQDHADLIGSGVTLEIVDYGKIRRYHQDVRTDRRQATRRFSASRNQF